MANGYIFLAYKIDYEVITRWIGQYWCNLSLYKA